MLIKPPGRGGPLIISQAPTIHTDLPATIFDLLGLPSSFQGPSMLQRNPTAGRRRVYGVYDLSQRFPEGYLNRLDLIALEGSLLDGSGWSYTRSILPPELKLTARTIDLGAGNALLHVGPGWSRDATEEVDGREITYVSGLGRRAVVFATLPATATLVTARVSAGEDRDTWIDLEVDDRRLGRVTVRGEAYEDVTLEVPPDSERPRISSLVFHFGPTRAADELGVKVDRLSLQPN